MAKKTTSKNMPDLSNATPGAIVDWLGAIREEVKDLSKMEGFYKEALKGRLDGETTIDGEQYSALIEQTEQARFNKDLAITLLNELGATDEQIASCYKDLSFVTIRTAKKG